MDIYTAAKEGDFGKVKASLESETRDTRVLKINTPNVVGETVLHIASREGYLNIVNYLEYVGAKLELIDNAGATPLHYACRYGHLDVVQCLDSLGADLEDVDEDGNTILHYASLYGHLPIVEYLVSKGAIVEAGNKYGFKPIQLALSKGHFDIFKYIIGLQSPIKLGVQDTKKHFPDAHFIGKLDIDEYLSRRDVDPSHADKYGRTSLLLASFRGKLDYLQHCHSKGSNLNTADNDGRAPLHYASYRGHLDVVRYLLTVGADIAKKDADGKTPLHYASACGDIDIVQYLVSQGADLEESNNLGSTPLHIAALNSQPHVVQYLIGEGAVIEKRENVGMTSLHLSSSVGCLDVVQFLVSQGAKLDSKDDKGMTALHYASLLSHLGIVQFLVSAGAKLEQKNKTGKTALVYALGHDELDIDQYLINNGARIDNGDEEGILPVHVASGKGFLKSLEFLFSKGAQLEICSNHDMTPLHYASSEGRLEVVQYLVNKEVHLERSAIGGLTPLHQASFNGHLEVVKYLREKGARLDIVDLEGRPPLFLASFMGHLNIVEYLHDNGEEVDKCANDGMTPLHYASSNGHVSIVQYVIDKGGQLEKVDNAGRTAALCASSNGHLEVLQYLDSKGADLQSGDNDSKTPLHHASINGKVEIVRYLVSRGAELEKGDCGGLTPLHYASSNGHLGIVQYLVSRGAEVENYDNGGGTPIHYASYNGHLDVIKSLAGEGAHIENVDNNGTTPAHDASIKGHLNIVQYLDSMRASVEKLDHIGRTPLHYASSAGCLDLVRYLVSKGAKPDISDARKWTPLHYASYKGHLGVVEYLINDGASLEKGDVDNRTPIHYASSNGHLKVVQYLGSKGAQLEKGDNSGSTPLHYAASNGHLEIVQYLFSNGVQLDKRDINGSTPLHNASFAGHLEVLRYLDSKGADISSRDQDDITPLHLASFSGHPPVLEYIFHKGAHQGQDTLGTSPLMLATSRGHLDCVRLLLENNADVEAEDAEGWTALHYAATSGNETVMEVLLDRRLTSRLSRRGKLPIHVAISSGNVDISNSLLNKESSLVNFSDGDGLTPVHLATIKGLTSVVELLLSRGAEVNGQSNDGQTPLHLAVKLCQCIERSVEVTPKIQQIQEECGEDMLPEEAMVQLLLNQGSKIDIKDTNGLTPIQYAKSELVRHLLLQRISEEESVHSYRELPDVKPAAYTRGTVGYEGGILYLEGYDVTMNVPPKAVRPGSYHNVSIGLAGTSQVDTEEGEFLATHGIECIFPEQRTYSVERPITLSIPHTAVTVQSSDVHSDIIWRPTQTTEGHRIYSTDKQTAQCIIKEREVKLTMNGIGDINHKACLWIPMKLHHHANGKRLVCTPFLPRDMEQKENITLRVYIHEDLPGIAKEIESEEGTLSYIQVHPGIIFSITPEPQDIVITCDESKTILPGNSMFNIKKKLVTLSFSISPEDNAKVIGLSVINSTTSGLLCNMSFMALSNGSASDAISIKSTKSEEAQYPPDIGDASIEYSFMKRITITQYYHIGKALGLSYRTLDSIKFRCYRDMKSDVPGSSIIERTALRMIGVWRSFHVPDSRADEYLHEIWTSVNDALSSELSSSTARKRSQPEIPRRQSGSLIGRLIITDHDNILWERKTRELRPRPTIMPSLQGIPQHQDVKGKAQSVNGISREISEDGSGLIRLENYQVEVHIPGNIPYSIDDVTVQAIDLPPPELVLKDDEAIISVGLDISTSHASFDTPVKVTMPHSAVFIEPGAAQIIMYHRPNNSAQFSTIASTDDVPICYVRHKDLDLYLDHFSEWWIVAIVKEYFIGKLFIFTPFVPLQTPRLDQHVLHLTIRDEIGNQAKVHDLNGYKAALGGRQFFIKWRSGELTITSQHSDTSIEDLTEVLVEKSFYYVSENDVSFTVDTSSTSGKSVIITYILSQSEVMKKMRFTMRLQEQETSSSENPITASSSGKRLPVENEVTDTHIGDLSKLLNPDLFYDLHVALGIEYSIAEGIKLNKATSDLPQKFTELLQTWNTGSTRTLADLKYALEEAGAGSLVFRILGIEEEQGSETTPTTPCPMYETAFTDEINVNDYHILKISKLLLQDNLSDLRVALGFGYSIAADITQLTPRVFERCIHLLQKWKAKSPRTVKQLKEILVQIDLGGIVNMLENEL